MYPSQLEKVADAYRAKGFELDGLTPRHLLQYLQNRTLWFIGDSQVGNLFRNSQGSMQRATYHFSQAGSLSCWCRSPRSTKAA